MKKATTLLLTFLSISYICSPTMSISSFTKEHVLDLYKNNEYLMNRVSIYRYMISQDNLWDWVWNLYPITKATTILEIGSGLGSYWQQNSNKLPHGCSITLTDISPAMVKATQLNNPDLDKNAHTNYNIADVEHLPFENASFETVFCHFVLFYTKNPEQALAELKRVTKPGGIISIITLNSNYCQPLYQLAHQLDTRFPTKDIATEQFDEQKADQILPNFFSSYNKYTFEREIKFTQEADLKPFLRSVAQGYCIPINSKIEHEFQALFEQKLQEQGNLGCFSRSALYICYR